jgi:hypothetical protein
LVRPTVDDDFSATTTTNFDNDRPSKRWFCIHRRSAPIAKPISGRLHMSRMSKTTKKNLDFFQPNVIYLPRTTNFILKPLLHNNKLFNLHHQVLNKTMLEVVPTNNNEALRRSAMLQTLGVDSVAKQEISRVFHAVPLTRRNEHKFNKIMSNWRKLRMKRIRNEHYSTSTFIEDVQRSKIELKFVIKQLKVNVIIIILYFNSFYCYYF